MVGCVDPAATRLVRGWWRDHHAMWINFDCSAFPASGGVAAAPITYSAAFITYLDAWAQSEFQFV